jgi:hypothetical protein
MVWYYPPGFDVEHKKQFRNEKGLPAANLEVSNRSVIRGGHVVGRR